MPTNTPVHKMYMALLAEGKTKADAAKIAQAKTGLALVTGRPSKTKGYGATYNGQYKRSNS